MSEKGHDESNFFLQSELEASLPLAHPQHACISLTYLIRNRF